MPKRKRPHPQAIPMGGMHSRHFNSARAEARRAMAEAPGGDGPAYWIYGIHAALSALGNPARRFRRLMMTNEAAASLAARLPKPGGAVPAAEILDRAVIDRALPQGAVHQGIAVLAESLPEPDLDEVLDGLADAQSAVLLLLDQVTDPQNVGAVLRSAAAFGAAAVVTPRHHAPPMTGALAKAASGAAEHVALVRVGNLSQAIERLKESRFWCVALDGEAGQDLSEVDLAGRVALALGAEGPGLRRLTRERCDLAARLPTGGPIADINVSNAAAVALYECARQRASKSRKGAKR